ncbi:iron-containing alcohol dehydrogenase [Citreimonas salinaria]|uniref:iron-containing alcohol dehydrogenase n=1 Tax=Citreimonas salinaria TaxID=321339 RepID=UPI0015A6044F|nr:iron-containing alcohol dehydrogenase [Citreimonas salinaria]
MTPFDLTLPRDVRFGRGCADDAAAAAAALGRRVLLVRGRSASFADRLVAMIEAEGCVVTVLHGAGEPTLPQVEAGRIAARDAGADCVVAVGGGSVIDLGKAVAGLAPQPGDVLDYLEGVGAGRSLERDLLPLIALPTTAGTGAEATRNAVIGVPDAGLKVSLRDPRLLPAHAFVDPALTDACPPAVTLASGLDAVVQVIEPYLSARANPFTDALCRDAIPRGLEALRRVAAGDDPDARDAMALTSLQGGIALTNAGLGAVHGLAGVIGGRTGMAHGAICGRLLVPVLRANRHALAHDASAMTRFDQVSRWIGDTFGQAGTDQLDGLARWIDENALPYLPATGDDDRRSWADAAARASSMKANPVKLSPDILADVIAQSSDQ